MKKFLSAATIITTTLCSGLPAFAADLDVYQEPVLTEVEFGSGWYLRGDVGYGTNFDHSNVSYYADKRRDFSDQDWDNEWNFGGGVGYTWTDSFRTDVTIDYYDRIKWEGSSSGSSCDGMDNSGCQSDSTAKGDMTNIMANAYYHLGDWSGFSPYLSGGLGAAYVEWDKFSSDVTCTTDSIYEECPGGVNTTGDVEKFKHSKGYDGSSDWRFAWSVGAGFDYRLSKNWLVDFGYRYTNIDDGVMVHAGDRLNGDIEYDKLKLHEFRAGLRYEIW